MHIAVIGCGHGEIDRIYEVVAGIEEERKIKVSLVLICGDFQSVRNATDLQCLACPPKYRQMHDFHRYYSGDKMAPILTIFIGGNHEASNYLQELPYGGWVAPNIYYLSTGIIRVGSLRIGGISGIFKGRDYTKGKHEIPPYNDETIRSVYHYRNLDIFRMKQVKSPVDVMMSHDWPSSVHKFGDVAGLLRSKPFFRDEIARDELGSRPLAEVLEHVQPSYWFSGHMHVKFAAVVPHDPGNESSSFKVTKFLALDKVLPRRQFLQVVNIGEDEDMKDGQIPQLSYDSEWLGILKLTDELMSLKRGPFFMPGPKGSHTERYNFTPSESEIADICSRFENKFEIESNFVQTAPVYDHVRVRQEAIPFENPQTKTFCSRLGVRDPVQSLCSLSLGSYGLDFSRHNYYSPLEQDNEEARSIEVTKTYRSPIESQSTSFNETSHNPDEILLDSDDDADEDANKTFESFPPTPHTSTPKLFSPSTTLIRKKLYLPPPKSTEDDKEESNQTSPSSDLVGFESILGKCSPSPHNSSNSSPLFVIDKIGDEPGFKKRRNELIYKDDASEEEQIIP